jgi:hypothetical protein
MKKISLEVLLSLGQKNFQTVPRKMHLSRRFVKRDVIALDLLYRAVVFLGAV